MSDQTFGDFFEGGQGGAPGVTWKGSRKGASYEGVIVPPDLSDPEKYDVGHVTTHSTNTAGDPLYWNPVRGAKPAKVTADNLNGQDARPVTQAEITIMTAFRANEFLTEARVERMEENEEVDNGLRRVFVSGPSLPGALREAMQKARVRKPEVGATLRVTLVKKEKNEHGGETNIVEVDYTSPTPETRALVKKYVEENADPVAEPEGDMFNEAPPF